MPTKPKDRDEGLEVHLAMARAMYHRRVTKPRLARKTAKAWVGMVCVPTWTIDDYTSGSLREEHDLPVVHVGPASAEHSFTMNGYTFRFIPVGTSVCVDTERIGKHIERSADRLGFSVTPDEEGYSNLTFKEDLIQVSWSNFGPLFPDPKYESPDRTCLSVNIITYSRTRT